MVSPVVGPTGLVACFLAQFGLLVTYHQITHVAQEPATTTGAPTSASPVTVAEAAELPSCPTAATWWSSFVLYATLFAVASAAFLVGVGYHCIFYTGGVWGSAVFASLLGWFGLRFYNAAKPEDRDVQGSEDLVPIPW